jgi:type VII secretion protein EccE
VQRFGDWVGADNVFVVPFDPHVANAGVVHLDVGGLGHGERAVAVAQPARQQPAPLQGRQAGEPQHGIRVGVIVDGHTVITMIAVWGKRYIPTLLHARHAETPNTLPLSVIGEQMHRFGLGVDVDVMCEGTRTGSDGYAGLYSAFLGSRPAAGKRTTTLVLRLDTRAADTATGLLWRPNSAEAAAAVTRRMVRALGQAGCRAQILTAVQMRGAVAAAVGAPDDVSQVYRDK